MSDTSKKSSATLERGQVSRLIRIGGYAAVIAGALALLVRVIGHRSGSIPHEALYATIDFCLLFATLGIWLLFGARLGSAGLVGFVIALTGIASILGPEPDWLGIDFYSLGSAVFATGLGLLSIQLIRARLLQLTATLWLCELMYGVAFNVMPEIYSPVIAGILVQCGFLMTGIMIIRKKLWQIPI